MAALSEHLARAALLLNGYRSRLIATSIGRVHVLDADGDGRGPPLVLLHGFSSSGAYFLPLMPRLRPRVRRLIAPDLPAHGFSDSPPGRATGKDIERGLIEALDAVLDEPAVIYGNSMGGYAAVRYALARPEKVAGLLLASPFGAPIPREQLPEFVHQFDFSSHAQALDFIDRVMVQGTPLRHLMAWGVRQRFARPALKQLLTSMTAEELLTAEQMRSLRCPVLVVWGKSDHVLPAAQRDFFRDNLPPGGRFVEPAWFGHSPYLEDPGAVARQIIEFGEQVESETKPVLDAEPASS